MNKGKIFISALFVFALSICGAIADEAKIVTYPAPQSEKVISAYTVSVNGKPLDIYKALSPRFEGGEYYFTYFDFEGAVEVNVVCRKDMKKVELYPQMEGVKKSKDRISFTADKPFKTIVIRDERAMPLVIFGNPLEKNIPNKDDPNVKFFDAGVHFPNKIDLKSNQTLYIAGGAVVKAPIFANGDNITVRGRGIISFDNRERFASAATSFESCKNLTVSDVIFKDAMTWTLVFRNCDGVKVDNVKICCGRMINDDAIDICNTSNISIKNVFARAQDDIIAIKGMRGKLPCDNMTVEDSILWTDSANAFRIGYECIAPMMRNLKCKNLYIPFYSPYSRPDAYWSHAVIWLQATSDMPMTDMHFDGIDIRSNGEDMPVVIANPRVVDYGNTKTAGNIANCSVKNVKVHGVKGAFKGLFYILGVDAAHDVKNMTFENIDYFGEKQKSDSPSMFISDFTSNIVVK